MAAGQSDVSIKVSAETQAAQQKLGSFANWLKGGFSIQIAQRVTAALEQIPMAMMRAAKAGVMFNDTLENAQIAIAGILRGNFGSQLSTFDQAMLHSAAAVGVLQKRAVEVQGTFADLLQQFRTSANVFTEARVPFEKWIPLAIMLSQAMSGMQIPGAQHGIETRQLFGGQIRMSRLAQGLGVTAAQVREHREKGDIADWLMNMPRMKSAQEAAGEGMKTLTGIMSNLTDVVGNLGADVMKGAFDNIKAMFQLLLDFLSKPEFRNALTGLANTFEILTGYALKLAKGLVENVDVLDTIIKIIATLGLVAKRFVDGVGHLFAMLSSLGIGSFTMGPKAAFASIKTMDAEFAEKVKAENQLIRDLWAGKGASELPSAVQAVNEELPSLVPEATKEAATAAVKGIFDSVLRSQATGGNASGLFATQGAARAFHESVNVAKSMLNELRAMNKTLSSGVPITEPGGGLY